MIWSMQDTAATVVFPLHYGAILCQIKELFLSFLWGKLRVFFLICSKVFYYTYPLRHLPCGDALRVRLNQELNMVVVDPEKSGKWKELMPKHDWNISRGGSILLSEFSTRYTSHKIAGNSLQRRKT